MSCEYHPGGGEPTCGARFPPMTDKDKPRGADGRYIVGRSLTERLLSQVSNLGGQGCWTWDGFLRKGYGCAADEAGRDSKVHRMVYRLLVGPIPKGLTLDHLCRNRACVRPSHLEPVTNQENALRGFGVGVLNARKTHCLRGHEFTPENTRLRRGARECRQCGRSRVDLRQGRQRDKRRAFSDHEPTR
jgi:hypothetical protein